jgi:hypothetical protein
MEDGACLGFNVSDAQGPAVVAVNVSLVGVMECSPLNSQLTARSVEERVGTGP